MPELITRMERCSGVQFLCSTMAVTLRLESRITRPYPVGSLSEVVIMVAAALEAACS